MLRVSAEDINTAVRGEDGYIDTAIEIEGGGYLATIEVFHQLHCLVRYYDIGRAMNKRTNSDDV
jgi:hypothetical protein